MAKRLNYQIGITADTSQFKAQLQQAFESLNTLADSSSIAPTMREASSAAAELKNTLQGAMNVNTGKLDLGKFNDSLANGSRDLKYYYETLSKIGPEGQKAFLNVAQSIVSAEAPLKRSNKLMDELWITMKNTVRWQITSSALHGFVGQLETAYGYSKSLDSSLNNIRIVTSKTADDMKEFAQYANDAAKALSTTTTEYTDASLIYYQQGLSDEEVKGRTDTTIKMANVSRQSAEDVSEQLTAVWNNFYDGSKSLEYYADVMTALGASTASSSDEIAEGIQKFAAVASTVGLSYEYAASALATLTANTRESASVVGTALRTLFTRFQGLSLGETLDDGTDLNKYSKALAVVGVQIKDASGELKGMDQILDETAEKWTTLTKAEQMALAQTVAGVRQYTQFINLMENWGDFQKNLQTAYSSTGSLQEQADIYAESWEAARDRVKASAEDIYDSLINPDFYIGVDSVISPLLDGTADVIDAMGGLRGILSATLLLVNKVYGDKISASIRDMAANVGFLANSDAKRAASLKEQAAAYSKLILQGQVGKETHSDDITGESALYRRLDIQQKLIDLENEANVYAKDLNGHQTEILQTELQRIKNGQQLLDILVQQSQVASEQIKTNQAGLQVKASKNDDWESSLMSKRERNRDANGRFTSGYKEADVLPGLEGAGKEIKEIVKSSSSGAQAFDALKNKLKEVNEQLVRYRAIQEEIDRNNGEINASTEQFARELGVLGEGETLSLEKVETAISDLDNAQVGLKQGMVNLAGGTQQTKQQVDSLSEGFTQAAQSGISMQRVTEQMSGDMDILKEKMQSGKIATRDWADTIVSAGNVLSQISMIFSSGQSLYRVFTDEDMTTGERILTILTSLSMLLPTLGTLYGALNTQKTITITLNGAEATASAATASAFLTEAIAKRLAAKATTEDTAATIANTAAKYASNIILLATVVAIAALTAAIYAGVKAYNADADAAKKAAEAAEETAEAAEEAQQEADKLRSTIESYDSAVDKLNECTSGTQEWRDALKEVNEAAVEVLNTAGKLSAEDLANLRNDDGTLNREALTDLQERADKRAENLSYASSAAEKYASDMQLKADAMALGRKASSYRDELGDTGDRDVLLQNYEELASLSKQELVPALRKLGFQISDSESTIDTWYTAIQDMADSAVAAGEKFNLITQLKVEEVLGEAQTTFDRAIQSIVTSQIDASTQKLTKEWEDRLTGSGINKASRSSNPIYEDALTALQEAGYDVNAQTDNAVRGTDNNRSLAFLTSKGEEVVYNAEQIAAMIAAAQALNKVAENADAASAQLQALKDNANVLEYLSEEDLSSTRLSELDNFENEEDIIEQFGGRAVVESIVASINGVEEATDDMVNEFISGIIEAAGNARSAIVEAADSQLPYVQKAYTEVLNSGALGDISADAAMTVASTMGEIFRQQGPEALKGFSDILQNLGPSVNDFIDNIDSIDWDNVTPESLRRELNNIGITADQISDEALPQLIEMMQTAKDVSLEAAQEQYAALKEVNDAIEDNTSTLTEEQIATLQEAGLATDAYFTKLADGTYALAEDATNLKSIIDSIAMKDLYDASELAIEKYQDLQKIYDFNMRGGILDTSQRLTLLEQSGTITSDEALDFNARLQDPDLWMEAAREVSDKFSEAEISSEDIQEMLQQAAHEAAEAQQAISDTEFRNDVEDFGLDLEETTNYAKRLEKELNITENQARKLAIANQRLDRGLTSLNKNLDDYKKALKESNKNSAEWSTTMDDLKTDLADMLNIADGTMLSDQFAQDTLASQDLVAALDGDVEALERLQAAAADDIMINIVANQSETETPEQILARWDALKEAFENTDITAPGVDQSQLLTAFNSMIKAGSMTKEQIEAALAGLHVSANVKTTYVPQTVTVPQTITEEAMLSNGSATVMVPGDDGQWVEQTVQLKKKVTRTYDAGTVEVQGVVPQYEIEGTEGEGGIVTAFAPAPAVTPSYSSTTSGGAGGGSGGGGGGSVKEAKVEDKDDTEIEPDRYHRINRIIQNQADLLEEVGTQADRAYGNNKLKLFAQREAEINKQIDNQNAKLAEAKYWLEVDAQKLQDFLAEGGNSAAIFGEDGEVINFDELQANEMAYYQASLDRYNNYIDRYNAMTGEQQETAETEFDAEKKLLEEAEKRWDKWQDYLSQYEETLDIVNDQQQEIIDEMRELADLKLQEIEYKLEIVIDVKDMKNAVEEFWKSFYETQGDYLSHFEGYERAAAAIAGNEAAMFDDYMDEWNSLQEMLADPYADEDAVMEEIQNLQSKMLDSAEAIVEWADTIEEIIPEAVSAAADRFAQFTDQLDHNTSVLETIKELYTLQGVTNKTDKGFATLQNNLNERLEAQTANAVLQKKWADEAQQRLIQAQAELDAYVAAGGEEDNEWDRLKKARDAYLEEFNEAQEVYLSLAQEAMETAQEMYLEQIERAVYTFGQAVSNGLGLDLLQDQYDHYIESEERYLDKVNEAYQVTSWYNKLQADIDDATNTATKERLKKLQKEIDVRRENNTLSQYDLDILEAKYNVLQAQIALEDAQNAKNNLQLVRDSQGNWNYQYTADQSQIDQAEQDLIDAQNDWYNIAKDQVTEVTGEIISTWQECQDAVEEIYNDMTLTDEERANKAAEIYQYYTEKIKYLENEKQVAIEDMTEAGNESLLTNAILTGDAITDLTGLTSEDIQRIVEEGGGSVIDILTGNNETIKNIVASNTELIDLFDNVYATDLENMTNNTGKFEEDLNTLLDQCEQDYQDYQDKVESVAGQTGTTLDDLATTTEEVATSTDILRDSGLNAAEALWAEVDAAAALSAELSVLAQQYLEVAMAMAEVAAQQASTVDSYVSFDAGVDYSALMSQYLQGGGTTDSQEYAELLAQRDAKIAYLATQGYDDSYWGTQGSDTTALFDELKSGGGDQSWYDYAAGMYTEEEYKKWMHDLGVPGFATGGYTGEFDDAKLAFLHEKELVLNQEDTNNILAAVNAVRTLGPDFFASIEKALDSTVSASVGLMKERLNGSSGIMPITEELQQNVQIEAVFPNATDRNEIEEAFRNLTNDASQYIRRRKE